MVMKSVEEASRAFVSESCGSIGYDINPDIFTGYARAAGAKRLEIKSPVYTKINQEQIALCSGISLVYGGLEGA